MSDPAVPPWKFWHPLPFWHVIVIFAVAQLSLTFAIVALREAGGITIPFGESIAAGLGGMLGVIVVMSLARKKLERDKQAEP